MHRAGIVHCDVKPSNILVFKDFSRGGAVLTDFAVAHSLAEDMSRRLSRDPASLSLDPAKRITHQPGDHPTTVQASLPYAPPEVLLGRLPSAASDEYALACTAVELITGDPPFVTSTQVALMYAQVHTCAAQAVETPPGDSGRVRLGAGQGARQESRTALRDVRRVRRGVAQSPGPAVTGPHITGSCSWV